MTAKKVLKPCPNCGYEWRGPGTLKPCPFCGGEAEIYVFYGRRCIRCLLCHAEIGWFNSANTNSNIKTWNRRSKDGR
jgi:hypothetical protein